MLSHLHKSFLIFFTLDWEMGKVSEMIHKFSDFRDELEFIFDILVLDVLSYIYFVSHALGAKNLMSQKFC